MKIFLIRHGESIQNTKENFTLKLPNHKVYLSDKGKEEADGTGKFLLDYVKKNNISLKDAVLWVSPYERTRQTADIINSYLKIKNRKEDITLIEQRYGLFGDMEVDVLRSKYTNEFTYLSNYYQNDGRFYAKLPQGESPYDVALRTKQFIDTIFRDGKEVLFVVSHSTTIRTIIMNWFHFSPEWFQEEPGPQNCSVILLDYEKGNSKYKYIYKSAKKKVAISSKENNKS